ncbi:hypothetical protein [Streptomyces sp. NPDC004296]|uniref:hypothetical protein n=1 Tax=Streptomyces sp. NPDC004296 TaxID=3364697 RepID=UPI0036AE532F
MAGHPPWPSHLPVRPRTLLPAGYPVPEGSQDIDLTVSAEADTDKLIAELTEPTRRPGDEEIAHAILVQQ